ncbi:hypothetical protein REPUB_Repub01dG0093200 [Reevesia pubescens]
MLSLKQPKEKAFSEEVTAPRKTSDRRSPSLMTSSDNEEEDIVLLVNPTANKPPEKSQRAPSAYNRFIKEEIRRLKAQNPNILHKEAFSTAAKNWAHFPPMHHKGDGEYHEGEASWNSDANDQVGLFR